jgi:hypothetical protein
MERRVSEMMQPTGKRKKQKIWTLATVWLMGGATCGGRRQQFSFLSRDDRQLLAANRAGCASGEHFPEVLSLGDWKVAATYRRGW